MKIFKYCLITVSYLLLCVLSPAYGDSSGAPVNVKARGKAFQKLDRDKDQLVSAKEWRSDVQTFLDLDCDHDQSLSRGEYIFADCKMDPREMAFRTLDENGNKVIEPNEWDKPEEDFNRLDRDHDGLITRSEFTPNKKSEILKQVLGQILVSP